MIEAADEIERLKDELGSLEAYSGQVSDALRDAKAEIERLSRDLGEARAFPDRAWKLSMLAQAELDNGDPKDALRTLVRLAKEAAALSKKDEDNGNG